MNVKLLLRIVSFIFCLGGIYSGVKFYLHYGEEIPTRSRRYAICFLLSMFGAICSTITVILQD